MIKRTKQNWTIGQTVSVGFIRDLEVMAIIPTPGDFRPDAYMLRSAKGVVYEFTPHCGLVRVDGWTQPIAPAQPRAPYLIA